MEKCKAYHIVKRPRWNRELGWFEVTDEECWGTREIEYCSCGGDPRRCSAYPEKRKKAEEKMNTAEMWLKAQKDGKTYRVTEGELSYDKNRGFFDPTSGRIWPGGAFDGINDIFELVWKESEEGYKERMTKEEAEKEFGIKIVGD